MDEKVIWTIGHSTHSTDEFINILRSFNIELLADIRGLPGSRRFPHFNKENLTIWLPENRIQYVHYKELGGRRKPHPDSHNTAWRHPAFRGYADYMETGEFINAVKDLEITASQNRTAVMCAESLWWKCHRSLVSDYLKISGWKVLHIMGADKSEEHPYTKPARIVSGRLSYEDPSQAALI